MTDTTNLGRSHLARSWTPNGHKRWIDGSVGAIIIDAMSKGANQTIAAQAAGISPALLGVWLRTGDRLNAQHVAETGEDPSAMGDVSTDPTEQLAWMLWRDVHKAKAAKAVDVLDRLVDHGDKDWRAAVAWLDRVYPVEPSVGSAVPLDLSVSVVSALERVASVLSGDVGDVVVAELEEM